MAKPHKPCPPCGPPHSTSSAPPLPTIPLTYEQREILKDPLVGDDVKQKIIKENAEAEQKAINDFLTPPSGGGGGDNSAAVSAINYQELMVIYGIEKKLWDEELASDEAFRSKLEAIVKSEKNKADSGHYRDPGGRDR